MRQGGGGVQKFSFDKLIQNFTIRNVLRNNFHYSIYVCFMYDGSFLSFS